MSNAHNIISFKPDIREVEKQAQLKHGAEVALSGGGSGGRINIIHLHTIPTTATTITMTTATMATTNPMMVNSTSNLWTRTELDATSTTKYAFRLS